jgi:pimeloyl-ACP methyl ester carboxylesterase
MKTIQNKIMLIALMLAMLNNLSAQESRNVIWVHGLDGSEASWSHYEQIFTIERQINSLRKSYDTHNGLDAAANEVRSIIDANLSANAYNPRNLAIGHSMGGLVIRNIDKITTENKRFGGLITVTSPNSGAPISNSLINGSVTNAINNAISILAAGPIAEFGTALWTIIPSISPELTPTSVANLFVSNEQVQNLIGSPTTNSELQAGSSKITELNAFPANIPRISIWANEQSPVHWRLIGSTISETQGLAPADQDLVDKMNSAKNVYENFYYINYTFAVSSTVLGFLFPTAWLQATQEYKKAQQWKKGRDWFKNSEAIWSTLIKSTRNELVTYNYCDYLGVGSWADNSVYLPPSNPEDEQWSCYTITTLVTVNYPSDGLIPKYTQVINGLSTGNVYEVKNANHIEVRNMSQSPGGDNTRAKFNEVWVREDWFKTPIR